MTNITTINNITWTNIDISALWTDIAVSSNGQYIIACIGDTNISYGVYISINYGVSFTKQTNGIATYQKWSGVAIAKSDPNYMYAVSHNSNTGSNDGSIYYTANAKNNTNPQWNRYYTARNPYYKVACSYYGQYAVVVADNGIYYATQYSLNWTSSTDTDVSGIPFVSISCNSSGNQFIACKSTTSQIYYSNTYGQTWGVINSSLSGQWISLTSDSTGQHLAGIANNNGNVVISNDTGINNIWSDSTAISSLYRITSSSNGQIIVSAVNGGNIYMNNSYGYSSWINIFNQYNSWQGISCNGSGSIIVACSGVVGSNGYIWIGKLNNSYYTKITNNLTYDLISYCAPPNSTNDTATNSITNFKGPLGNLGSYFHQFVASSDGNYFQQVNLPFYNNSISNSNSIGNNLLAYNLMYIGNTGNQGSNDADNPSAGSSGNQTPYNLTAPPGIRYISGILFGGGGGGGGDNISANTSNSNYRFGGGGGGAGGSVYFKYLVPNATDASGSNTTTNYTLNVGNGGNGGGSTNGQNKDINSGGAGANTSITFSDGTNITNITCNGGSAGYLENGNTTGGVGGAGGNCNYSGNNIITISSYDGVTGVSNTGFNLTYSAPGYNNFPTNSEYTGTTNTATIYYYNSNTGNTGSPYIVQAYGLGGMGGVKYGSAQPSNNPNYAPTQGGYGGYGGYARIYYIV